jgi:hypothetical protein
LEEEAAVEAYLFLFGFASGGFGLVLLGGFWFFCVDVLGLEGDEGGSVFGPEFFQVFLFLCFIGVMLGTGVFGGFLAH